MSLAFVFPGQGSQSIGMVNEMLQEFSIARFTLEEASDALGYNLTNLVKEGPLEVLNQTQYTQPALLAASYACWRVYLENGGKMPMLMAGHSLGEYTALVCSEALGFEDGIKLVALRGEFMQQAVASGVGAMAAIIGLDNLKVEMICESLQSNKVNGVLSPANFNSIGQVVIAGHSELVDLAIIKAKEDGAKMAVKLPVSVPSHCRLMGSAAVKLEEVLADISLATPKVEIIHNYDVSTHMKTQEIRASLVNQLTSPVRWVETINLFNDKGITNIVECGPGKVLTGLNKRILTNINNFNLNTPSCLSKVLEVVDN